MNQTYRYELLTAALEARVREVTEYQVNIENYKLAIDRIGDDAELQDFKTRIAELLSSSILEQKKAQTMLDVISIQLEGAPRCNTLD